MARAHAASMTGTARWTMQGSCRPCTTRVASSPRDRGHRPLGLGDGGRGPQRHAEQHRHAVGDAAVDAAGVIGGRTDLPVLEADGIVGLAAVHGGKSEPRAEGHRLHRRDRKQVLGYDPLHVAAEIRASKPCRHPHSAALHNAAHRVAPFPSPHKSAAASGRRPLQKWWGTAGQPAVQTAPGLHGGRQRAYPPRPGSGGCGPPQRRRARPGSAWPRRLQRPAAQSAVRRNGRRPGSRSTRRSGCGRYSRHGRAWAGPFHSPGTGCRCFQ